MDRRNFLKLFGQAGAAASVAATGLINIPEAEPKIQLLEEKKIITNINDEIIELNVKSISIDKNYDFNIIVGIDSSANNAFPVAGILNVEVEFMYNHSDALIFRNAIMDDRRIICKMTELYPGKIFEGFAANVTERYDEWSTARMYLRQIS